MSVVRRIARPLLASMFVVGGVDQLKHPSAKSDAARPGGREAGPAAPPPRRHRAARAGQRSRHDRRRRDARRGTPAPHVGHRPRGHPRAHHPRRPPVLARGRPRRPGRGSAPSSSRTSVCSAGCSSRRSTPRAGRAWPTGPTWPTRASTGWPARPGARRGTRPAPPPPRPGSRRPRPSMRSPDWSAPTADGPVRARVVLPGSKSLTNRYLVLAALATEVSRLRAPLRSRDTLLMADALRTLGVGVDDVDDGDWLVTPAPLVGGGTVDCGLAGNVMRFVPPLAGLADGPGPLRRRRRGPPPADGPGARGPAPPRGRRRRRRPRGPALHRAGHRCGARRHGHHRRLGVLAVRLGPAAVGRRGSTRGSPSATTARPCRACRTSR